MNQRDAEFLDVYQQSRIDDQVEWYERISAEYKRSAASLQTLAAGTVAATGVCGALAGAGIWSASGFAVLAVLFPALAAGLTAFGRLYEFEGHAEVYGEAAKTLSRMRLSAHHATTAEARTTFVQGAEAIIRSELDRSTQLLSEKQDPTQASPPPPQLDAARRLEAAVATLELVAERLLQDSIRQL
jgi:SMODS and SLOG-associating 2TM effector domain 1